MDRDELAALYAETGAAITRRCQRLLGDREEARDMVQEVFVKALSHAREFRGEAAPFTWLYRISTNLCLNRLRDRKATVPLELVEPQLHAASPEQQAASRQAARTLLAGLDERTLGVVVYRYLDGMSQDEIARVSGWSRKTIGKKLAGFEARVGALKEVLT